MSEAYVLDEGCPAGLEYGTARHHGLVPGVVFRHHGYVRDEPSRSGVRLTWIGGPKGQANLDTGELFDCGRPQTKFWACVLTSEEDPPPVPSLGTLEEALRSSPRQTALDYARRAVGVATGPVHPGVRWLVYLDQAGLSQAQAASQMGVSAMTLSRYINGHGLPSARVVVEFARVVGRDPHVLWQQVAEYELAVALEAPLQG